MQDRVQLKREETVGEGVALSDINPLTNTQSVDDSETGAPLSVTIERMWQAINNALDRIVNSVNGRDGVVVLSADDVGLGNVTNVSFSTIKDWVIDEIANQFGVKRLLLYDTLAELNNAVAGWLHDKSHANTPFYLKTGDEGDSKSYIGYLRWDDGSSSIVPEMKVINTVGYTDASIIYNTTKNGRNLSGGGIGVNIANKEDALKILDESGDSGLYIDKDVIAQNMYFFNGLFGLTPSDPEPCIWIEDGRQEPANLSDIVIRLNGIQIGTRKRTPLTFKKHDIIITNFSDKDYRHPSGALFQGIDEPFVCREAAIGIVTQEFDPNRVGVPYIIELYTIKPYVGMGLKYVTVHDDSQNKKSEMIAIDLMSGKVYDDAYDDNISGLNTFNRVNRTNADVVDVKTHHTVTPVGDKSENVNSSKDYNSLFITPDFSLNVIPYNTFITESSPNIIRNWPVKTPTLSTGVTRQSFIGTNLLKRMPTGNDIAVNMSGLRIFTDQDEISNTDLGKSDNDTEDKLSATINDSTSESQLNSSSGGLAVNVGRFLEIGTYVGDEVDTDPASPIKSREHYYDGGKVNVRVDDMFFSDTDNRLGLKVSQYVKYDGRDSNGKLGGGLTYTTGINNYDVNITPGLTINRGLGLRMSHYDRLGHVIPEYTYTLVAGVDDGHGNLTWPGHTDTNLHYYQLDGNDYVEIFVYGEGTQDNPYNPPFATNTYYTRTDSGIADKSTLAVSVVDRLYTASDIGGTGEGSDNKRMMQYGGLRYIIGPGDEFQSSIGLRVNNNDSPYGHALRLGDQAIGINENNVVGVQLYRESDKIEKDINPLRIDTWDEETVYPYVKIVGLSGGMQSYPTKDDFPSRYAPDLRDRPRTDVVYYSEENKRRYVWNPDTLEYDYMFTTTQGSAPTFPGKWNRVVIREDVDPINHTYFGAAYKWQDTYTVHLPLSYNPITGEYDDNKFVDAQTASQILKYYSLASTASDPTNPLRIRGYYYSGQFYYDSAHHNVIPHTPDEELDPDTVYIDMSSQKPMMFYQWYKDESDFSNSHYVSPLRKGIPGDVEANRTVTVEDIQSLDVNHNGVVDAVDSSIVLRFYAVISVNPDAYRTGNPNYRYNPATNTREQFANYLVEEKGVEEITTAGWVEIHRTGVDEDDGSFIPGLNIFVNENQGMTTLLNGDIKKALSVKIYDKSSGYKVLDTDGTDAHTDENGNKDNLGYLYTGGLRFNKDGFLGIRVNAAASYDATNPEGREGADLYRPHVPESVEHPKSGPDADYIGARGLMIYPNNVLGIQLTKAGDTENDWFKFDEFGSLEFKGGSGGGGGEYLTITDSASHSVQYNGSTAINITLGPGLMLEDDPQQGE